MNAGISVINCSCASSVVGWWLSWNYSALSSTIRSSSRSSSVIPYADGESKKIFENIFVIGYGSFSSFLGCCFFLVEFWESFRCFLLGLFFGRLWIDRLFRSAFFSNVPLFAALVTGECFSIVGIFCLRVFLVGTRILILWNVGKLLAAFCRCFVVFPKNQVQMLNILCNCCHEFGNWAGSDVPFDLISNINQKGCEICLFR